MPRLDDADHRRTVERTRQQLSTGHDVGLSVGAERRRLRRQRIGDAGAYVDVAYTLNKIAVAR